MKLRVLYLATKNQGKRREIGAILQGICDVRTMDDLGVDIDWEESGATFHENAAIKARAVSAHTDQWVLADDSGLEVDALGGEPGVHSARWAGTDGDDEANRRKLLEKLEGIPKEKRQARFVCCLALSTSENGFTKSPHGVRYFVGALDGSIATKARGLGGFGYDPLFIPKGGRKTLAELSAEEKNVLSHRRRALDNLRQSLLSVAH